MYWKKFLFDFKTPLLFIVSKWNGLEHMSLYEWRVQAILSLFSIIELPNGALSCNLNFLCNFSSFCFPCRKRFSITIINMSKRITIHFFSTLLLPHIVQKRERKNGIKLLVLCYRFIVIMTNDQHKKLFLLLLYFQCIDKIFFRNIVINYST